MSNALDLTRPRILDLRKRLVSAIPCNPDTAEARSVLEAKNLSDLMLIHVNHAARFVRPRPRVVHVVDGFWDSARARANEKMVRWVIAEIQAGLDLTPRLSDRVHTDGFTHPSRNSKGRPMRWEDKDFALNAYGMHHLHLGEPRPSGGPVARTRDLVYARFWRDEAVLLAVADHNAFDDGTARGLSARLDLALGRELHGVEPDDGSEFTQQQKNRLARSGLTVFDFVDGKVVVPSAMMTSGNRMDHVRHVGRIVQALGEHEPKLEERSHVEWLFSHSKVIPPEQCSFRWQMDRTALQLVEEVSNTGFVIVEGLN